MTTQRIIHCILLYFLCFFSSYGQEADNQPEIDKNKIVRHVYYLGSDRLEGRGTGSEGERLAADYIAHLCHDYGLLPIAERMTYFQNIPMHGSKPLPASQLTLYTEGREELFTLGKDYLLYKTGEETFLPTKTPLVFVGYGITAPEFDYNDYQSIDVQGKVVVFLSGEPYSEDENFFKGKIPTIYSYPEAKQRTALSYGARGSIMIPVSGSYNNKDWSFWRNEFSFEHITLAYAVSSHLSVLLNPDAVPHLFENSEHSFQDVIQRHKKGLISSFALNSHISFNGQFSERDFISRNVMGLLRGSDPDLEDSYIVLSAHFDHLGIGPVIRSDSIYNGVLDNAAGVAALLEIARVFSLTRPKPKRSILFLFFTGEEKGLLGSTYYIDHPVVPLYKTVANINIDGLAGFDQFNSVIGVGAEYSDIEDQLKEFLNDNALMLSTIPAEYFIEAETINRSDQFSFMKAGIPSLLLTEGLDYKNTSYQDGLRRMIAWNSTIYHTPFDDLDQDLNFDAMNQHTSLIYRFTRYLADLEDPPEWKAGSPFINARLQTIAEKR